MKALFEFLYIFCIDHIMDMLKNIFRSSLDRLEIAVLSRVRLAFLLFIFVVSTLLLLFFGFILMHLALFLYLPWEMESKIILMVSLGFFYIVVSSVLIGLMQSKKQWLLAIKRIKDAQNNSSKTS